MVHDTPIPLESHTPAAAAAVSVDPTAAILVMLDSGRQQLERKIRRKTQNWSRVFGITTLLLIISVTIMWFYVYESNAVIQRLHVRIEYLQWQLDTLRIDLGLANVQQQQEVTINKEGLQQPPPPPLTIPHRVLAKR